MDKKKLLILLLVLCFPVSIFAETVLLKSGQSVEGKLIERNDKYIEIDFQDVMLTYYWDEIENIDGKSVDPSKEKVLIKIPNPGYLKPPNKEEDIEINSESTVREILTKTNYYYSVHDFDKAIELCELALKKTNDQRLLTEIYYSLSSNYLEKGINAHMKNKDDSFYELSLRFSRKVLEVLPNSWQALANIGSVYLNTRNWGEAVRYYSEAEKYLDKRDPNYAIIETERKIAEGMSKNN